MHDVATIAGVLCNAPDPLPARFSFRGNGAGFRDLEASLAQVSVAAKRAIDVGGNLPEAEWIDAMTEADVALVTMPSGAEGLVMPSKTYSAMIAGQAILAICPDESDLADIVKKHGCGWVVRPGDVAGVATVIREIGSNPERLLEKRHAAYRAGHQFYDQPALAVMWENLIRDMAKAAENAEKLKTETVKW